MNNAEQRAATRQANRLLRSAGYGTDGRRATGRSDLARVAIKPATPIDFPEGLTKSQRKEYRKKVMLARGEAVLVNGQLVTAVEQKIRQARHLAPIKKIQRQEAAKALEAKRRQERLERERAAAAAELTATPKKRLVKKAAIAA